MTISTNQKISILSSVFIACLVAANLVGAKITMLFGVSVSVGIFVYPVTFLITDALEEVFGKEKVTNLVYSSVISLVIVLAFAYLAISLPPAERYADNEAFKKIFSSSIRMTMASIVAFFISQTHDIWAFNFWKRKTGGKYLWLRNNLSTMTSQFLDTTIFMFLAFYKMTEKFDAMYVFSLIIPYWIFKIIFALCDTPFVYGLVWWLKKPTQDATDKDK